MNTRYIYTFGVVMTVVVALLLASLKTVLNDRIERNEKVFNMRAVLEAVAGPIYEADGVNVADLEDDKVISIFENQIQQYIIDANGVAVELTGDNGTPKTAIDVKMADEKKKADADKVYPAYEFTLNGKRYYIFSVIGNGLWDIIWGNIALESDLNTIAGVSFDHAGETPGLGAEIRDNQSWKDQFLGNRIFADNELVGVNVRKGGAVDEVYEVDGLSGATITGDGVTDMIMEGFTAYAPYIKSKQSGSGATGMLVE